MVVLTIVLIIGWAVNAAQKLLLASLGVDTFGQFMAGIATNYLVSAAAGANGPVLYACRYIHYGLPAKESTMPLQLRVPSEISSRVECAS